MRTALVAALVLSPCAGAAASDTHAFPGYYFALGAVACAAIVWVSKWLGRAWLQRAEDHYDEDDR